MNLATAAALGACTILGLLTLFQIALALGAPWGHFAWGGKERILPAKLRIGSVTSIVIYALIAVILLERVGLTQFVDNTTVIHVAAWVIFGYFTLGILLNAISRSKPERYTMTPVTLALSVLTLLVALS